MSVSEFQERRRWIFQCKRLSKLEESVHHKQLMAYVICTEIIPCTCPLNQFNVHTSYYLKWEFHLKNRLCEQLNSRYDTPRLSKLPIWFWSIKSGEITTSEVLAWSFDCCETGGSGQELKWKYSCPWISYVKIFKQTM